MGLDPVLQSIKAQIRKWIINNSPDKSVRKLIADDDPFLDLGVLDSMGVMNLVNWLEEEYCFAISEADFDLKNFSTISRIAMLVRRAALIEPDQATPL